MMETEQSSTDRKLAAFRLHLEGKTYREIAEIIPARHGDRKGFRMSAGRAGQLVAMGRRANEARWVRLNKGVETRPEDLGGDREVWIEHTPESQYREFGNGDWCLA